MSDRESDPAMVVSRPAVPFARRPKVPLAVFILVCAVASALGGIAGRLLALLAS